MLDIRNLASEIKLSLDLDYSSLLKLFDNFSDCLTDCCQCIVEINF